jgi:EAL domain-containing protein (putative c-di-GMP-specific phosphodiesterase class I)
MMTSYATKRALLDFISNRWLKGELASALRPDNFALYVQPEVDLSPGRVVSSEALIRWNFLEHGLLGPSEFVPFAQADGMLLSIGAWLVGDAAETAAALRAIEPTFHVCFNVSAPQLGDPRRLERIARFGDSLPALGVEISESVAQRELPETLRTLTALKSAGLSISLDGFGSVAGDMRDRHIVGAVFETRYRFGFETVVKELGQGYYLGHPMPVHELVALADERQLIAS